MAMNRGMVPSRFPGGDQYPGVGMPPYPPQQVKDFSYYFML